MALSEEIEASFAWVPAPSFASEAEASFDFTPGHAFGEEIEATFEWPVIVTPTSVTTEEAFGNPTLVPAINPVGIASAEAFGNPVLPPVLLVAGIASAEAFGNDADVHITGFTALSILSLEEFGVPSLSFSVSPALTALDAGGSVPAPTRNTLVPPLVVARSPGVYIGDSRR